jgi:hypothetical protein
VDGPTYELIEKFFGKNYEIKRNRISTHEGSYYEIHLKRLKVLVLSNLLIDGGCMNYIRPRYIQMSKLDTVKDLKHKILRCLYQLFSKTNQSIAEKLKSVQFKIVVPEISDENKKFEMFSIVNSFTNKFTSLNRKIKGEEVTDDSIKLDVSNIYIYIKIIYLGFKTSN